MEISKVRFDSWLNQIEKKIFIFFIALFAIQTAFLNSHLVFILPLLATAFVVGKLEMLFSLGACLLSIIIFKLPLSLFALCFLFIGGLSLLSYIYVLKTRMIPILCTTYMVLIQGILWANGQAVTLPILIVNSSLCGVLCFIYLKAAPVFVHQISNQEESYHADEVFALGIMMASAIFSLTNISNPLMMILLRFLVLCLLYIVDNKTGYQSALFISFILLIGNIQMKDEVLSLLIPLSVFYLISVKTKFAIALVYLFSHWLLPFFITNHILLLGLEVVLSAILFMLIPNRLYRHLNILCHQQSLLATQVGGVVSYQRKMTRQLENFSDLFFRIANSFDDATMKANVLTYVGNVYETVCSRCMNCDSCFNRHQGDHRLVKVMRKGIIDGLNKEELHYIERYCLNMAEYKKAVREQHKLFAHQKDMNEEYHNLKHHLYTQLSLVGQLLKHYASHVDCSDIHGEESMKDLLEGYHYQIMYIHKDQISKDEYCIDIGITEITKVEVYDVVIPVLEKFLDTKLNVLTLENNAKQMGYTHLVLSNHQNYQLVYGIQQISKDANYCGDSYLCFRHHQHTMIALSDGMGYGSKAHEESELTLDVFSRLLKSGISLDESIQTINSLLKIKNRMEMFTTLDLLMFNTNDAKATFLKNGATPSFVYHYNQLEKVQTRALPIGIVSKVDTHTEQYQCSDQDLIIMYSDGFDDGIEDILETLLNDLGQCHPQKLADAIMKEMTERNCVDDDATIIVARVEDITQIHID